MGWLGLVRLVLGSGLWSLFKERGDGSGSLAFISGKRGREEERKRGREEERRRGVAKLT